MARDELRRRTSRIPPFGWQALGYFCVLIASFQLPAWLGWKQDLAKLTPFHRKPMWVHGAFAVLTIAFGTLTLHDELLRGDRAAIGLAAFTRGYWIARIAVDFTYYEHKDWPAGRSLVIWQIWLRK